uniref:Uncharacterized protein n=1 Tax=Romanomermis culicivorax TaxID=13658 RepID=A0A915K0C8_ROMCU
MTLGTSAKEYPGSQISQKVDAMSDTDDGNLHRMAVYSTIWSLIFLLLMKGVNLLKLRKN